MMKTINTAFILSKIKEILSLDFFYLFPKWVKKKAQKCCTLQNMSIFWNSKIKKSNKFCGTYCSEYGHGLLAEPHRVENIVVENRFKQVVFIIRFERRLPGHHLVHQHPQSPPVHGGSVLQLLEDLVTTTRLGSTNRTKALVRKHFSDMHLLTHKHVCSSMY